MTLLLDAFLERPDYRTQFFMPPTCPLFEIRYERLFTTYQEYKDSTFYFSQVPAGSFFKANTTDLSLWIGEETTEAVFGIVKNHFDTDEIYHRFGEKNGLVMVDNRLFAARIRNSGFNIVRPVTPQDQTKLADSFNHFFNLTDPSRIPNLDRLFAR
jgi:hypothetical protein